MRKGESTTETREHGEEKRGRRESRFRESSVVLETRRYGSGAGAGGGAGEGRREAPYPGSSAFQGAGSPGMRTAFLIDSSRFRSSTRWETEHGFGIRVTGPRGRPPKRGSAPCLFSARFPSRSRSPSRSGATWLRNRTGPEEGI